MTYDARVLRTLATDLLDVAAAAYDNVANAPTKPARRLVRATNPPHLRCEDGILAVSTTLIGTDVATDVNRCARRSRVGFAVEVVRCHPTIDDAGPASADDEQTAALGLLDDAWTIWSWLLDRWAAGALFASAPNIGCELVSFGDGFVVGPSGGVVGWRQPLETVVSGPITI